MSTGICVVLSAADMAYRDRCVAEERPFTDDFLMETRSKRLGRTVRDLAGMLNYERSRELADEAVIMRLSDWQTARPAYIDWETINARAAKVDEAWVREYAEFRQVRASRIAGKGR